MSDSAVLKHGPKDPSWWKDGDLDPALVSKVFGYSVKSARLEPHHTIGGAVANLQRLILHGGDDKAQQEETFIVKRLPESSLSTSLNLGLIRECDFLMWLKEQQDRPTGVVDCEYATWDGNTGQKILVLQDLSQAMEGRWTMMQSHPYCAKDDAATLLSRYKNVPTAFEAIKATFCTLAEFHAMNWENSTGVMDNAWCRGSQWLEGQGRSSWENEQNIASNTWRKIKSDAAQNWNPKVYKLVDASISKINWEDAVSQFKSEALTLCHGDCWPANVMLLPKGNDAVVPKFVDWELVGIGSGRQDLAQFMLNVNIDFRRKHQEELLQIYVEELNKHLSAEGNAVVTYKETLDGYIYGGAAKICWMLPLMTTFGQAFQKFFHDAALAWFDDFNFTAETIPQPRL